MSASLHLLATIDPPCNARTWLSTPHPYLPLLATACADKTVRISSLQTFAQQATISGGHKRSVRSCTWKPTSPGAPQSVLATGSFDASAGIWKRRETATATTTRSGVKGRGQVPNGRAEVDDEDDNGDGRDADEIDFTGGLAGGDPDGDEHDDEDDEWRLEVILDGHDSEIKSLAFCPTAPLLATCSRDKSVWIWEELIDDGGGGMGEGEDNFETMAVLQDHEGDVKCVAWHPTEQLLASGSYDDSVRLWREDVDDWACCALLTGHGGTVWWVEFEGSSQVGQVNGADGDVQVAQGELIQERQEAGPRLLTCSDDRTIRIWRRRPKDKPSNSPPLGQARVPSIWKNRDFEEDWIEERRLPQRHDRPIYSVSWSRKTGRIVSAGSDGQIIVYEERWRKSASKDVDMPDSDSLQTAPVDDGALVADGLTEWVVIATIENAHDVFEINHVVWAPRADGGETHEGEEVIVSTGDDGEVKIWTLNC